MKIAIVSVSIGNGHNAAAYALLESLQQQTTNNEVRVYDILEDSRVYQLVTSFYLEAITKTPQLYNKVYHWSQDRENPNKIFGHLNFICIKYLKKIKETFSPDLFIFTHPIPANSYSHSLNVPAFTVITDYSFHHFWFNLKLTGYFVANNEVKKQLIKNNYPANRIYVTGLPVKKSFNNRIIELWQDYTNYKNPLILIMGGGLGIGPLEEIIGVLNNIDLPFEALVLTGKNHTLYEKIKDSLLTNKNEKWNALPFSNDIPALMQKASILITKAGGITLTEALASNLPTIIYKPLPGQEEENAQYASSRGWATWAKDPKELVNTTRVLLEDQEKYCLFKQKIQKYNMPNSTSDIVKIISNVTSIPLRRTL